MTSNYSGAKFDDLMASNEWNANLQDLNRYIVDTLTRANEPPILNGNLFYGHLVRDFHTLPLDERFDQKRRNVFEVARRSTCMLEIGVNAGHSMLLALMANPELKCIGIDVCQKLNRRWARVDLYVPAAFNWLRYKFGDRVQLIKGNSLVEVPSFSLRNPDAVVDFLHLDGAKDTHMQEFLAIRRHMPAGAYVVHDDAHLRNVRIADRQLRRIRATAPLDYEANGLQDCEHHVIRAKM